MTRATNIVLVLGLLIVVGCRPTAPPVAEATPKQPERTEPELVDAVEPREIVEAPAPEVVAVERAPMTFVAPPGVGASLSACEQSCGEVHDCAVLERTYTPATAAAIELSCVRACLGTPERATATLFGCGRPAAIEPGTCGTFLACIDSAWPQEGGTETIIETPDPDVHTDPCARVCDVFARCWDPSTTPELIEQCAEQCRQALDAEAERKFGACADLPGCADIMTCVESTPGATRT